MRSEPSGAPKFVTVLKSIAAFDSLAHEWHINRSAIQCAVHPATWCVLVVERLIDRADDGHQYMFGFRVSQDPRVGAGIVRLVYRGGTLDLPVDLDAVQHGASTPAGGTCECTASCWNCTWKDFAAEGCAPADALRTATFMAEQHRSATGHGVTVSTTVHLAAGMRRSGDAGK